MKTRFIFCLGFVMTLLSASAQENKPDNHWKKWSWLLGEWKGEGDGKPGQGSGTFTFEYNLDKKIIERKSHSEYPATENKPLIVHDDLMVIYTDASGNPSKSIYFDNEGHVLQYNITYTDESIVMLSERVGNMPVFKLSYINIDAETILVKFEFSQDGEHFKPYVEGKSKKVK